MLVIEGAKGKSVVVNEYLENLDKSENALVCMLQDGGSTHFGTRNTEAELYGIKMAVSSVDEVIQQFRDNEAINYFNNVVFYVNATKADIPKFKKLEKELGLNSVLTVQTSDEITKYTV